MRQEKTTLLRKLSIYGFDLVTGSHNFFALLEFDVTDLRRHLRTLRTEDRGGSLFAFLLKAVGKCLGEFPEFNAMIDRRKTSYFDEVDVNIPIEIETGGIRNPKQYIVRELINLTAVFNHDLIDGAPAARFINRLRRYVETAYAELSG